LKARTEDGLAKYRIDPNSTNEEEPEGIRPTVYQARSGDTTTASSGSGYSQPDVWEVSLVNLPSAPGSPVQMYVNGSCVFSNDGFNGQVTSSFLAKGNLVGKTEFVLKITAVNFEVKRELFMGNGKYIKFETAPSGMKFVQSQNPF